MYDNPEKKKGKYIYYHCTDSTEANIMMKTLTEEELTVQFARIYKSLTNSTRIYSSKYTNFKKITSR